MKSLLRMLRAAPAFESMGAWVGLAGRASSQGVCEMPWQLGCRDQSGDM
jgi:hypothetical protein